MTIQVLASPSGRVAVLQLLGEHDVATAPEVRLALQRSDAQLVALDLEGTTFLDSTVLGVVVSAWKRFRADGRQLVTVNARGPVAKVLVLTKLDEILTAAPRDPVLDAELLALLQARVGPFP